MTTKPNKKKRSYLYSKKGNEITVSSDDKSDCAIAPSELRGEALILKNNCRSSRRNKLRAFSEDL